MLHILGVGGRLYNPLEISFLNISERKHDIQYYFCVHRSSLKRTCQISNMIDFGDQNIFCQMDYFTSKDMMHLREAEEQWYFWTWNCYNFWSKRAIKTFESALESWDIILFEYSGAQFLSKSEIFTKMTKTTFFWRSRNFWRAPAPRCARARIFGTYDVSAFKRRVASISTTFSYL